MADLQLTLAQLNLFREALLASYSDFEELRRLVRYKLDDRLTEIPKGVALGPGIDALVAWAEDRGDRLGALSDALLQDRPGNPKVKAYLSSLTAPPPPPPPPPSAAPASRRSGFEAIIEETNKLSQTSQWRDAMKTAEARVCRIEAPAGQPWGTGFLVGADLVLTNHHVYNVIKGKQPIARFGYLGPNAKGSACPFQDPPLAVSGEDELDFALLRLTEAAGNDRGWFKPKRHQFTLNQVQLILQHPNGRPLELGIGQVGGVLDIPPRVTYSTNTEPGSSGSPVFTMDWELVAIHYYGKTGVNNAGIPISAIWDALAAKNLVEPIGHYQSKLGIGSAAPIPEAISSAPAPAPEVRDFFVSFNKNDRAWATWIAWQLEAEGYTVFLQDWDFRPGENFMLKMDESSARAKRTLGVLSPEYLESYFCKLEWAAAYRRDRLLLVRVKKADVDGILGPSAYIDLVGKNPIDARAALLAGVKQGRAKPDTAPPFPTEFQPQPSPKAEPAFPGSLPAIWNVRRAQNPHFTGREELRRRLRENLEAQHGAVLTQAIAGLGGVGKTTLATEYAYEFAAEYDVVWELPCEDTASARLALAELAVRLGVEPDTSNPQAWESAREWLEHHGRWLLLCDNAVSYDAIAGLLPRGGQRGHVLITSRNPNWRKLGMEPLSLPPLSPAEGAQFLLKRTGRQAASDEAEAQGLSQDLGGLPLALELAAAYVEENAVSLGRYRARLAEAPLRLLEPVARTWEISLGKLPPAAVRLLERLAFLAPDAIPRGLLEGWDLGAEDGSHLDEAVGALRRYSLVTVEPDGSLGVHRLLQRVVRSRLADPAAVCGEVLRHVNERFQYDPEQIETWEPADPLYEHAVSAALHAAEQGVESAKTSRLRNQAGLLAMYRRADLGAALPLLQRALAIDEKSLGAGHPNVAILANNIGQILQAQGDLEGALTYTRRALAIDEKSFGPDHPNVARAANNIGAILKAQGDLESALTCTGRALAIWEKSFGPDHPNVASAASNIGQILQAQGDLEGALTYTRRALAIDEKSFGPDHPNVAIRANNIGQFLQAQGDLEGALTYTRRALAIDEKSFGPDHPKVAIRVSNIGQILKAQGDLEGALTYTRRGLAILTKFLGPNHPDTRTVAANLAAIERDAKR